MKKLGLIVTIALSLFVAFSSCKSSSNLEKAKKNQYKNKLAEFKKGGWTIFGSVKTLEVALLEYYDALEKEGAVDVVGIASSFISKNVGQQSAMNAACNNYARIAQTMIKGRIASDLFSNADEVPAEFDKFYAAYESMVVKEIKGELKPYFSVIRTKGKDEKGREIYEMQSFFIVNENEAAKARMRAMETAMQESQVAQKYAKKVSNFVQSDAVKVE